MDIEKLFRSFASVGGWRLRTWRYDVGFETKWTLSNDVFQDQSSLFFRQSFATVISTFLTLLIKIILIMYFLCYVHTLPCQNKTNIRFIRLQSPSLCISWNLSLNFKRLLDTKFHFALGLSPLIGGLAVILAVRHNYEALKENQRDSLQGLKSDYDDGDVMFFPAVNIRYSIRFRLTALMRLPNGKSAASAAMKLI